LITRPVALDIGRVVFAALNKAELIALLILLILVRVSGRARELWMQCSALILILLAQSVWLLPQLAARSQQIVAGVEPAPSMLHGTYSALELLKLLLLLYLGFRSLQATGPPRTLQDQ
jgi:high-affinity Fe2+/Pb2+ permease